MIEEIRILGYRKYRELRMHPNPGLNVLVGGNESGKSTLLEAIGLALTQRLNGRSAQEELNPHWFNESLVNEYFANRAAGRRPAPPEIFIELYLKDVPELQKLAGPHNLISEKDGVTTTRPGVRIHVLPNREYAAEFEAFMTAPDFSKTRLLPVEYYKVEWRDFAWNILTHRPRELTCALIDSRTVRSSSGMDFHMRQILSDYLDATEKAHVSLAFREMKREMTAGPLEQVNTKMATLGGALDDSPVRLAMDQTSRTSWETTIAPHVGTVPFSMSGQGQQASVKIALAMKRSGDATNVVMIEEPENHLSHTSLAKLVGRINELSQEHQQVFITTHSSYVLNRMGLDTLILLSDGRQANFGQLSAGTTAYFKKLPGYDTLRMVLAEKIVLVEGPSDEIVFERFYRDLHEGRSPMQDGIDVISMRGLALKRCLELTSALDKRVAATRDNDNEEIGDLRDSISEFLAGDKREVFIGDKSFGATLEPQIVAHNSDEEVRKVLGIRRDAKLSTWMEREKTEGAMRIAESDTTLNPPTYMKSAAEFFDAKQQ